MDSHEFLRVFEHFLTQMGQKVDFAPGAIRIMHKCVHLHCTGETYTLQVWQILSVAGLDPRRGLIVVRLTKNDIKHGSRAH